MFNVRCSMFNVQCSMFNVQCSMFNVQCSMFNYQLSIINYQLSTINYQLSTINYQQMKKYLLICTLIFTSLVLVSCSSSDSKSTDESKPLKNTKWVLRVLNGTKIFTPESGKEVYVTLESGSDKANGSGGCNNFFTTYTTAGKTIKFGLVASTEMFCQNSMDTEQGFFKALSDTQTYSIKGSNLYLSDATGVIAKLEAVELNSK
jgi:heat shock protein HslJ